MTGEPLRHETYTHGHAPAVVRHHARRTADEAAAFLLPELRPGMRLLDVGCGPGSITRGLAERVAPGEVVGLDLSRDTLEAARQEAAARGIGNVSFQAGSVYELPFPDASFDVAYAHQVFQHLRERAAALREMLRVVRPGGLVAVRDVDWGTAAYWPPDRWLDRFLVLHQRAWYRNGGEPRMGRELRALYNEAGVGDVRISAAVWCYATPAETAEWGDAYADRLLTSPMGERLVEYGYASRADVEAMAAAFRSWGAHPDALWVFTHVAALGTRASSTETV
jgi:SAM-dependent methyltransferase